MTDDISKAASMMGKKSAKNPKKDSKYYSDLAKKRWAKEKAKKDGSI